MAASFGDGAALLVATGGGGGSGCDVGRAAEEEVREALTKAGLTMKDLAALRQQKDGAVRRLQLSPQAAVAFERLSAVAQAHNEGTDETRLRQELDVLDAEGNIIMQRSRSDVHRGGLWHRVVNVWVFCPDTSRVLLGQRSMNKSDNAGRWTCACRRIPRGELSMTSALHCLDAEFSMQATADSDLTLAFTTKCPRAINQGMFAGQVDGAWVDVYIKRLDAEIAVEKVHFDPSAKKAVNYVTLEELDRALKERDEGYVIPTNEEYTTKLLFHLRRLVQIYGPQKPSREDSQGDAVAIIPRVQRLGVSCSAWNGG